MNANEAIRWEEPRVIEWEHGCGCTYHELSRVKAKGRITIFAPVQDGSPQARMVLRHEQLHAQYDTPRTLAEVAQRSGKPDDYAEQAVGDAYVHLRYWPKGEDRELDSDAIQIANKDVLGCGLTVRSLLIAVRSMAIVKLLSTEAHYRAAKSMLARTFNSKVIEGIERILGLVQSDQRKAAEAVFNETAALLPARS